MYGRLRKTLSERRKKEDKEERRRGRRLQNRRRRREEEEGIFEYNTLQSIDIIILYLLGLVLVVGSITTSMFVNVVEIIIPLR